MTDENMSLVVFDPMKATIADIVAKDKCQVFDHTTEEGETALRSWVYKVRQDRSSLEKVRVAAKSDALAYGKKVDGLAKELKAPLDKIIADRMKPLDDIEAQKRADAEAIVEAERVEAERVEAERVAAIQKQAEENERRQAELDAKEAALEAEKDKLKAVEAEKEKARRDLAIAEQNAKDRFEQAEREKQEAIEAEKEKARKAEAERVFIQKELDDEKARLAEIERKRVEDEDHQAAIRAKIHETIYSLIVDTRNATAEEDSSASAITLIILKALKEGRIPNVTINY